MAGEIDNLVLEHLRAIRGDIAEIKTDLREFRERLGLIEAQMAGHYALYATLSHRIDRVVEDVQLIGAALTWSKPDRAATVGRVGRGRAC